ncbi:hypothetical protein QO239_08525 [Cupriavidus taiwanensis]|uniref:hypothetical protein n=1 Tax=Cupriavidus taiwanensis TaxID=164546 RepID=UPI0025403E98|nr:hypothetical protein [Cupriavidus taiwanensis]MDK3022647.1 hypothetical protein [Cupriavidus taiwanensis]
MRKISFSMAARSLAHSDVSGSGSIVDDFLAGMTSCRCIVDAGGVVRIPAGADAGGIWRIKGGKTAFVIAVVSE